jgi:hypothetical protein
MNNKNTCAICKIRAYIQCDLCEKTLYFCSRGHLSTHKIRTHRPNNEKEDKNSKDHNNSNKYSEYDLRKLFELIQTYKKEADLNIVKKNYVEAIMIINKCLPLSKKFYQEDHIFVLIFKVERGSTFQIS